MSFFSQWVEQAKHFLADGGVLSNLVDGVAASVLMVVSVYLSKLILGRMSFRIAKWQRKHLREIKFQKHSILNATELTQLIMRSWRYFSYVIYFCIVYIYLQNLFGLFDSTLTIADKLYGMFYDAISYMAMSVITYLPNLVFLALLFIITRWVLGILNHFFIGIKKNDIALEGFYPEWADPTYKITRLLIIAFVLVLSFPYLPGSDSPAFKGVSLFLGVLFSLGSTSAVANIISGVMLTYTRAFANGDRVRIADAEGDVVEKTLFVTRVRTVKNVDITIPNMMVLGNHIINYSAQAVDPGILLHTTLTIGYDVDWRKIHELLLEAAALTAEIENDPEPFVLQKSLNDFYVEYELNGTTRKPKQMTMTYSELHQNIQDLFCKAGIEIASPHLSAIQDGNKMNLPDEYLPKNYKTKGFSFNPLAPLQKESS